MRGGGSPSPGRGVRRLPHPPCLWLWPSRHPLPTSALQLLRPPTPPPRRQHHRAAVASCGCCELYLGVWPEVANFLKLFHFKAQNTIKDGPLTETGYRADVVARPSRHRQALVALVFLCEQ